MTGLSHKCQYALRAGCELAKRDGQGPVKVSQIAEAQAIPARFLNVILGQLRQGGFVVSRRGAEGGYMLARSAGSVKVGDIIRFIEGSISPAEGPAGGGNGTLGLYGQQAFMDMWRRARDAVAEVYDSISFRDLLEAELAAAGSHTPDYCI